jgi:SNF2 family DNA or RNA helicase
MELIPYKFKTTPYEHQHIGFSMSCRSKYFAYLMDLGTGKTKVTLDCAAYMFDQGWINALMVFGNNGSYTNWVSGVQEHLPSHIKYSIGVWSSKNSVKKMEEMNKAIVEPGVVLRIFLMNIEAIAYSRGYDAAYKFVRNNKTLAVVDESTTIGNPTAARTKAALKIGAVATARRILTGSCVDNRPMDAWSQFQFLANGALGYTSYYAFRAQYAELEDMKIQRGGSLKSFKIVTGYKNLKALQESIAKVSYIVKKEDCLDLPKKTIMYHNVELTEEQAAMYESLKKRAISEIQKEGEFSLVTVKIALTKMLRLHQLVCGHIKDDDRVFHEVKSNRLKALEEIIDETSGRVIIWTSFTYDVDKIVAFLRNKYGNESTLHYHGATTQEEREHVKVVFKRGGEVDGVRFLVANDKTGGYGNNFTAITTSIYYSYDFDNNVHHQTMDRIHRIGQIEPVTYVYLRCMGTIDEKILSVLTGKTTLANILTPSNWRDLFK